MKSLRLLPLSFLLLVCSLPAARAQNTNNFELRDGDRVVFLGDTFFERETRFGFIEHLLTTHWPERNVTFRNLGWSADTPLGVSRAGFDLPEKGFDRLKEQLALVRPTVAFLSYGMTASFDGDAGLPRFRAEMEKLMDTIAAGATGGVRFVLLGPLPHEKLPSPLPAPGPHGGQLTNYNRALLEIAVKRNAHFVNLLELVSQSQVFNPGPAFTDNGIHPNSYGHRRVAESIAMGLNWEAHAWRLGIQRDGTARQGSYGAKFVEFSAGEERARLVFQPEQLPQPPFAAPETNAPVGTPPNRWQALTLKPGNYDLLSDGKWLKTVTADQVRTGMPIQQGAEFDQSAELLAAIRAKNELFFHRWRPQNNTYLFLFRKHEQGQNAKEIPQFDPLIEEWEKKIAALRKPRQHTLELLPADPSRQTPAPKPAPPVVQLPKTTLPPPVFETDTNIEITLYAENPLLAKPIQMNFDERGRLWVASSEVYPQIKPGEPANDKIIILEDSDGDGRAEKSTVFADGLLIPTGVEPGDGGCYVGHSTELLHLKDTDGDGRADTRRVVLSAFGTEDTHHILHTLRLGHDGQLHMNQSIYIHTHIETPHGVTRLNSGGTLMLRPGTMEVGVLMKGLVNSWGHAFDEYGQSFVTDGASSGEAWRGGLNWVIPQAMFLTYERARRIADSVSPGSYPKFCGLEALRSPHFPDDWQGGFVTCDFRAHRIVRFAMEEQGSAFVTRAMPDLVRTKDVAFRPIDIKLGPDGALYIADWSNPIIQHGEVDFRDPRRDHEHGRIWRVAYKNRAPAPKFNPAATSKELLAQLTGPNDYARAHARRLLRERGALNVLPDLAPFAAAQTNERARLEALWLYQSLDLVNTELLQALLEAKDHRVRAAAVRVLAMWQQRHATREGGTTSPDAIANYASGWPSAPLPLAHRSEVPTARALQLLTPRIADEHPRVRVEALRALARIPQARAAELALTAADTLSPPSPRDEGAGRGPGRGASEYTDKYLDYALWLTINDLAPVWIAAVKSSAWKPDNREKQLEFALKAIEPARASEVLSQLLGDKPLPRDGSGPWIDLIARAGTGREADRLFSQAVTNGFDDAATVRALAAVGEAIRARNAMPTPPKSTEYFTQFFDHPSEAVRLEAVRFAGAWKNSSLASLAVTQGAAKSAAPVPIRLAAITSLREIGGSASATTLDILAHEEKNIAVRRSAILALASLKLDRATAPAIEFIKSGGLSSDEDALNFFRDFLKVKGSAAAFAKALPKSGFPAPAARAGLRAAREGGRNEPDLALALTRASGLDEGGVTLTDAELKQLAGDVTRKGDPARGEIIYRRKDLACLNCHAIGGVGGKVGPDMTSIGASAPVDYLVESVWFPNKKIKEGYHSVTVETKDGEEYSGTLARETGDELVLRDAAAREVSIRKNNISNRRIGTLSIMPAGLIDNLPAQDRIDLFRFLSELGKPGPYDAAKGNIARAWRIRPANHTDEQRSEAAILTADTEGKQWLPVVAHVDGKLTAATIEEVLPAPGYQRAMLTSLYAAAKLDLAKSGPVELRLTAPANTAIYIDGKAPIVRGALNATSNTITAQLSAGSHTIILRLDAKHLPPALRLESSEGTFSTN